MAGRCRGWFGRDCDQNLETEGTGQKWTGNEADFEPTWATRPIIILGEQYKLWGSSLWSFLHSPFSSFLSPNIHLKILFSNKLLSSLKPSYHSSSSPSLFLSASDHLHIFYTGLYPVSFSGMFIFYPFILAISPIYCSHSFIGSSRLLPQGRVPNICFVTFKIYYPPPANIFNSSLNFISGTDHQNSPSMLIFVLSLISKGPTDWTHKTTSQGNRR